MSEAPDLDRRFAGVGRLYGDAALACFRGAHACVVGIGGVGSWAAEALARSAIGQITLIDLDNIAESNVNRQIHALGDAFGCAKVSAMAERIRLINPQCIVHEIEDFVTPDNAEELLAPGFDVVIDAIDDSRAKIALIAACKKLGVPLVTTGGAGGRTDPTRIRIDDLSRTSNDALLARVRQHLRQQHGFPRERKGPFGISAIYSQEPMLRPSESDEACPTDAPTANTPRSGRLACTGYGSAVTVTASFGFAAAAEALRILSEAS